MNCLPCVIVYITEIVDLGMAVMARCNAVICFCCQNLVGFELAVSPAFFRISCLEKSSSSAATVVVRFVGKHFDEIFFPNYFFDDIAKVLGHRIAE